ncbi:leucine rich repeat LRR-containing protein [Nitzschia inconspicua]|uniref:Leucine rich repeat LRR-containing protein n=1 Tax=Nitzschia inconspicua TaxID=303405 RepID=A0A9K3LV24_9STRA|nr:leucine rich repeat LRR-containing protein [Nitzschia inconspicua]
MGDHEDDGLSSTPTDPVVIPSPPRIRTASQRRRQVRSTPPSNSDRPRSIRRNEAVAAETTSRRRRLWQRLVNTDREEEQKALEMARRLEYGAMLLLEKLFAYLSQLPEEEEENVTTATSHDPLANTTPRSASISSHHPGISLPAAAVAWLAGQLYPIPWEDEKEEEKTSQSNDNATKNAPVTLDDIAASATCSLVSSFPQYDHARHHHGNEHSNNIHANMGVWLGGVALRDRLSLLRFLLPRVKMIRITRQAWPPELPLDKNPAPSNRATSEDPLTTPPRRHRPPSELNCSTISSVNSALTMEQEIVTGTSPRLAFLQYMHQLHNSPAVDLRVFPRLVVLMLDSVPPSWILNLHTLQPSLQVLRLDRAAVYHLPHFLFSKPQIRQLQQAHQERQQSKVTSKETIGAIFSQTPSFYPNLTHVKLDHCNLGDLSGLSSSLSKLRNVQQLSLQHNDIQHERSLKGIRAMINLSHLDLRYNLLQNLPRANLYIGGQIQTLKLSHNQISTTRGGLDRCYALRELWLDGNCIRDLHQVSGLARLPQLEVLRLYNNPVSTMGDPHYDPGWKVQLWTWFQEERRATVPMELPSLVDLAGMVRGGVMVLHTGAPTEREWMQIQEASFSTVIPQFSNIEIDIVTDIGTPNRTPGQTIILQKDEGTDNAESFLSHGDFGSVLTPSAQSMSPGLSTPNLRSLRTTRKSKTRRAKILNGSKSSGIGKTGRRHHIHNEVKRDTVETKRSKGSISETASIPHIRFSVEDVLVLLQEPGLPDPSVDLEQEGKIDNDTFVESAEIDQSPNSPSFLSLHEVTTHREDLSSITRKNEATNPFLDETDEVVDIPSELVASPPLNSCGDYEVKDVLPTTKENLNEDITILRDDDEESVNNKGRGSDEQKFEELETHTENDAAFAPKHSVKNHTTENRIFPDPKPKVGIIKLQKQVPTSTLSLVDCDWDELIKRVSEGRIPDGLVKSPVIGLEHTASAITLEMRNGANKVFSDDAVDLLPSNSSDQIHGEQVNQSLNSLSASGPLDTTFDTLPNTLPDHVWKDDNSALSSLGASLENIPPSGASKFQIAEENSFYDGPDSCRDMKVMENLRLYFEVFVFTETLPTMPQTVLQELEEDHDDWQSVILYYPRIQLWPDDRRRLERLVLSASAEGTDLAENRERFRHLWDEEIIPCGKPALRRLPPNRRVRLGFHGDKLFEGPDLDAYSDRRNVLLCVSSKAFYVILREDAVTLHHKEQAKQRRFPLPIDKDVLFRDAAWPHAIARHSLLDLEVISIGFEFQRLTLRFRNASFPKSDPFVYVILCCNKKSTVRMLQQLQKAVKDLKEASGSTVPESATLAIENDSNLVFDALTEAVAPESLGTILHYQILQQCWKHGDRGTVRRACVVTETNIFLLDEDYTADGHNLSDVTVKVDKMADVIYRKVDEASLKQVTEVQAAGNDPRAITIIISGLSTLSRTHRWRLVCRDREGAERLVDDVRKAVSNFADLPSMT